MQVVVDGLLTTYTRQGNGPGVLILHGWADQSRNWQQFANELAKNFDVIIPDLPGFGGSQAPPTVWGLDDYARFVNRFLDKIAATPVVIIGHSNGGAIAIRGLGNSVLTAERLVLLASAGVRTTQSGRKLLLKFVAKTGKAITMPLPAPVKKKLRSKLYTTIGSDLLVAEHMQETFKKVVAQDVVADAGCITIPTLLIYGEQDADAPVNYGRCFHEQIDGSTLEVLGGAGHFLYRDRQAEVVRLVREFVA